MRIIALSLLYAFLSTPATLENGRCSACVRWHVTSTVTMSSDGMSCKLKYCGAGYYTENGTYVSASPCNTCTATGWCSRGHQVTQMFKM